MSQRPLVVVTDRLAEAGVERPVLESVADIRLLQTNDELEVARRGPDADVLLVYYDIKLTQRGLSALTRFKAIIRCGVGFDNVDLIEAGKRGIVVCNVPDYGTEEVADHAIMLLLALPTALGHTRSNRTLPVIFGLGCGLLYLVSDGLLTAMGEAGVLPPGIAAWGAPIAFAAGAVSVMLYAEG